MHLTCLILAAGRGTRLKSARSKMLLPLDGRPLVTHAVSSALALKESEVVVVVGYQAGEVRAAVEHHFPGWPVRFALQAAQRGTGDAVAAGLKTVRGQQGSILILSGDVPLLESRTLSRLRLLRERQGADLSLLTMVLDDPARYGRVIRRQDQVQAVVEFTDASRAERSICEVNGGIYCADLGFLRRFIGQLGSQNAQGELYLTDLVARAAVSGRGAVAQRCSPDELQGVNTWSDLARVAATLQQRVAERLMLAGVQIEDPARIRIESGVKVAADARLGLDVELTGRTRVGYGCYLEAGVILRNVTLGRHVHVRPYCVLEDVTVAAGRTIGPFVHLHGDAGAGVASTRSELPQAVNSSSAPAPGG